MSHEVQLERKEQGGDRAEMSLKGGQRRQPSTDVSRVTKLSVAIGAPLLAEPQVLSLRGACFLHLFIYRPRRSSFVVGAGVKAVAVCSSSSCAVHTPSFGLLGLHLSKPPLLPPGMPCMVSALKLSCEMVQGREHFYPKQHVRHVEEYEMWAAYGPASSGSIPESLP